MNGLTLEQETIYEKNIIWLFGHPRGGTTWTSSQLLSYKTNSINEPHIEEHLGIRAMEFFGQFTRRIDNPQKNPGYFFSQEYKDTWMIYLKKLLLNRFYAETKDIHIKTIIKEVCTFGGADILAECLKLSKIIILLRDGRDQVDSLLDARSEDGFMTKDGREPITGDGKSKSKGSFAPVPSKNVFIRNQSKAWGIRTQNFLKTYNNHPKELRYMVKYEDLLNNTFEELKKLYEFIGIEISDEELQKIVTKYSFKNIPMEEKGRGKFTRSATPGKWKENFSEEEIKIMNQEMGDLLKNLGYEI